MLNAHAAVLQAAFPSRHIGDWRGTIDRGQVRFANDPMTTFSGVVQPGGSFETTLQIPADTVFASVQIGWGPLTSINDLALYVYDQNGNLTAQSNAFNLPGLTGKSERVSLNLPGAGTWRVKVRNSLAVLGTPQSFNGLLQVGRAQYGQISDTQSLSPSLSNDVYQNIRSFSMWPTGTKFRPDSSVTRAGLATALVLGARVPQYLPAAPTYSDVRDNSTRWFVESAQASPAGSLSLDVAPGERFRPNDNVTRLAAAVAMVRAAGLRSEAEAKTNTLLLFLDSWTIPIELRGYVAVAVSRGFLQAGTLFRPQNPVTRAELARAIAVLQNKAVQ